MGSKNLLLNVWTGEKLFFLQDYFLYSSSIEALRMKLRKWSIEQFQTICTNLGVFGLKKQVLYEQICTPDTITRKKLRLRCRQFLQFLSSLQCKQYPVSSVNSIQSWRCHTPNVEKQTVRLCPTQRYYWRDTSVVMRGFTITYVHCVIICNYNWRNPEIGCNWSTANLINLA